MLNKKQWSAKGARDNCPRFALCPMCYGCRNFDSSLEDCRACQEDNAKDNICATERHTPDRLAMMIRRETIVAK